jgi:hypothetical protein
LVFSLGKISAKSGLLVSLLAVKMYYGIFLFSLCIHASVSSTRLDLPNRVIKIGIGQQRLDRRKIFLLFWLQIWVIFAKFGLPASLLAVKIVLQSLTFSFALMCLSHRLDLICLAG